MTRVAALLPNRRRKTTTLNHYGHVQTKPRDVQARVLSPTRRHNPQPLGLNTNEWTLENYRIFSLIRRSIFSKKVCFIALNLL